MKNAEAIKNNTRIGYETLRNSKNSIFESYLTKKADATNAIDKTIKSNIAKYNLYFGTFVI